ncbi:MAG: hypothetical protein PHF67_05105, partial [Candidatus Nanoarchaeia archaeon]|nr:hypothetical protein [Candidatus Nanoarchaeia archaeon]
VQNDANSQKVIGTQTLLMYARVSRKQNPGVSTQIYEILKSRAKKERHYSLYAMVCSETREFSEAAASYEKARCFVPAINFRLHLGLPTESLEKKALEQAFYQERDGLKECLIDKFVADRDGNIVQPEQRNVPEHFYDPDYYFSKSRRLARRFGLPGFLAGKLRQNGLYFALNRLRSELETGEDSQTSPKMIGNVTQRLNLKNWGNFFNRRTILQPFLTFIEDLRATGSAHFEESDLNPMALFQALGLPRDIIEILILNYINLHSTQNSRDGNSGWDILSNDFRPGQNKLSYVALDGTSGLGRYCPAIFSDFGLDVVRGMFKDKRYVPLIEVTPLLIPEFNPGVVKYLKGIDSEYLRREIAIQEQIKDMVHVAGRRVRRKYSKIGFDYHIERCSERDFLSLKRMGFGNEEEYEDLPF